jgi:Domain of unknown function (DUF4232)
MAGPASRSLRLAGMAAAGVAVAAAAGCASSSGSSTAASAPAASSSSAPAASSATSAASSAASGSSASPAESPHAVTSPTPSGAGSTSGGAAGLAGCATGDLKVTTGNPEGAAGSTYLSIRFTNTSSASCTLYGYPGVSLAAGSPTAQVGAAADRQVTAPASVVTLEPGQTGSALLRIVQALNYPTATCSPTATAYLRIYPPNETQSVLLPFKAMGCTSDSVKLLTIAAVRIGAGQQ